ncbi:hypothetical protein [Paenibacillus puldeungensis]|uniref:hypothetical protein n=1 Tax=Paenibacillus puldeungensis TaxID=696536 RepID=UPI0036D3501C
MQKKFTKQKALITRPESLSKLLHTFIEEWMLRIVKLLIIEDDSEISEMLSSFLKSEAY